MITAMVVTELRLAARRLARDRWTACTAVLTVALGAGLTIAVFAIDYGLMLRPLPYDPAGRLSLIDVRVPAGQIDDWRSRLASFERLTSYSAEGLLVSGSGDTRLVRGAYVDAWFFNTLQARPLAGRVLSRDEPGAAVLSERFARAAGLAPEALLGRQIVAGGTPLTVVGVLPDAFAFPSATIEIWIPSLHARAVAFDRSADARRFRLAGWLRHGISSAAASDDVERLQRALQPDATARQLAAPIVESAHIAITRDIQSAVAVSAGAAGVLWIVTCANLATILIGRIIRRRRELAVCSALGAGRWRRTASLLSESVVITGCGTLLGVLLALAAMTATTTWAHDLMPRPGEIRLDAAPAAFAAVSSTMLALVATVLALPALGSRATLQGHFAGATAGDRRARSLLLVAQVALVVVLLSGGALLMRTVQGLLRTDLGLDGRDALVARLVLTPATAFEGRDRWPLVRQLLDRIRTVPGVRFAGAGSSLPPENAQVEITVRYTSARGEESHRFSTALVTPGYLEAIGARLLDGRHFQESDLEGAPSVILSESAARAVLEAPRVAGRELPFSLPGVSDRRRPTVIGVIADIRYSGLEAQPDAAVYVPWHLAPMGQGYLAVRASGASRAQVVAAIRTEMRELDPHLPHTPIRTFDEIVERAVGIRRLAALLGATLAGLAFGMALIGLTASVLRSIEERRRELAIRSALGATPSQIVRLIGSGVVALAAAGLVLGTAGALATGRMLRALVAGVGPYDAVTLGTVAALVMTAALLAAYLPARLAAQVDPAEALKLDW